MLAANGRGGLATVALRPSGIFGEGDPLLVPLTVANAKRGKMKYIIGSGTNLMDFTYVGNVAQSHLLVRNYLDGGVFLLVACNMAELLALLMVILLGPDQAVMPGFGSPCAAQGLPY